MKTCSECDRSPVFARGFCRKHYDAHRRNGDFPSRRRVPTTCTLDGCDREHVARGMCRRHYDRWRYTSDPSPLTPEERHARNVEQGKKLRTVFTTPEQRSAMVAKGNRTRRLKRLGLL